MGNFEFFDVTLMGDVTKTRVTVLDDFTSKPWRDDNFGWAALGIATGRGVGVDNDAVLRIWNGFNLE